MKEVNLIGYACGWGAQVPECKDGPLALRIMNLPSMLKDMGAIAEWDTIKKSEAEADLTAIVEKHRDNLPLVTEYCQYMYNQVMEALHKKHFPVMLGGDHSMAIGTWSAITQFYKAKEKFGLLWIDAHMDSHTRITTPSGAYHGMPLSYLLGLGNDSLAAITGKGPTLNPRHLCLLGIRSYEREEDALLRKMGVKIFTMKDVRERGMPAVVQEALSLVTQGTKGFGVTIDVDAFDPVIAPAVGSPEFGGLLKEEAMEALHGIAHHKKIRGVEIAEFNPHRDRENMTAYLIKDLLKAMFEK